MEKRLPDEQDKGKHNMKSEMVSPMPNKEPTKTCTNINCPERTGGECNAGPTKEWNGDLWRDGDERDRLEFLQNELNLTQMSARKADTLIKNIVSRSLAVSEAELIERVESIDNYPESVFGKPWDGWEKDIDELAKSKGHSIQHIAAHYAHWQEGVVKGEVIALIKG